MAQSTLNMNTSNEEMTPGQTLNEIRELMNRSTRSYMSGWTPLLCGLVALAGAVIAGKLIRSGASACTINIVAGITLILGVLIPLIQYASWTKEQGNTLTFSTVSQRLLGAVFFPVTAGGVLSIALETAGLYEWIPAAMLLFYGLGVINLGHYSEKTLPWPGYLFLITGALACFLREYPLVLWSIGFSGVHIVYGIYLITRNRG